jgi:glycosyltransferase involved in cell wall biosynthesis
MAVIRKSSADPFVHELKADERGLLRRGRGFLDRVPAACLIRRAEPLSLGLQSVRLDRLVGRFRPDVVHLHWVNGGMVSVEAIAKCPVPIVWTMHDMWTFTGGCHYSGDCRGFTQSCKACPKVHNVPVVRRAAEWVHGRKRRCWTTTPLHAIAPSRWMASLARQSSLFRDAEIATIGYCIDAAVYNPAPRAESRRRLGLARGDLGILFVNADQPRKGALIISEVLSRLRASDRWRHARFMFAGGMPPGVSIADTQVMKLPATHDESAMAAYYAAADALVLPSYEDNLPNVIIEALACGTPVVAFPSGGISEMVTTGRNGLLTNASDSMSLVDALEALPVQAFMTRELISSEAHARYNERDVAEAHVVFYESFMRSQRHVVESER